MKKYLKNFIARKQQAISDMRKRVQESNDIEEVRSLGNQIAAAQEEIEEARAKLAECSGRLGDARAELNDEEGDEENDGAEGDGDSDEEGEPLDNSTRSRNFAPGRVVGSFDTRDNAPQARANIERRAKTFAATGRQSVPISEARAVLVSGGKIATPTEVGDMHDAFTQVSSIVDMVHVEDCEGMGSYEVPYEINSSTASNHTEGEEVSEGEPEFDFVTIMPETAAVVSYVSRKVRKLTPVKYADKVRRSALTALRKYASALIVRKIKASALTVKKQIASIDATTLRRIALAYGGDEGIEGQAVLVLNKTTLTTLGDIRGTNEKQAIYKITADPNNPNTGVIEEGGLSVKYCLNKNMANDELIYGNMQCFELALFGDYEVLVAEETKITKLLLTIVGDVELGGDVVVKDGFIYATVSSEA